MFGWFSKKKEVEQLKDDTKSGFDSVKKDMSSIGTWIKHLDSEKDLQKKNIDEIRSLLSTMQEELEGIKNVVSIMNDMKPRAKNQTSKQVFDKQVAVYAVQKGVQTAVQTLNFDNFSVTERAIIWVLLNSDLKLSYDDIASILGKERSTIRGHLNRIKQKSEGLIRELVEQNGKKECLYLERSRKNYSKRQK